MKKALVLLSILFCFAACEKQEVDYRDKYVGDYAYRIDYSDMHVGRYPASIYSDTTWYYSGYIKKSVNSKDKVLIHWGNDTLKRFIRDLFPSNELVVDSDGNLSSNDFNYSDKDSFYPPSYIRNDTVRFNFSTGGAGSSFHWEVTGVRYQ